MTFDLLIDQVYFWAKERDLIKPENVSKQMLKVVEELGELAAGITKNNEAATIDGLGDTFVTLIILSYQLRYEPRECLKAAYDEIKARTGTTVNGVFIKDEPSVQPE
jgi:NTP pyrophosphatase (non-canonical NTP hydrolase)